MIDDGLDENQKKRVAEVQERLNWIRDKYGLIPLVVEEMSKYPEAFIPYFDFTKVTVFEPKHLDRKTLELATISAGSALASEHCLGIHLEQARASGASKGEIMEVLELGAYMAFIKSQSVSLRLLSKMKDE